jgi:drug/metabolite transporter (DMT)-like permease
MSGITESKKTVLADFSLLIVALFWGSNFVIMKYAFETIAPFTYLGIRFSLAAFLLALIFWKRLVKATPGDYLAGLQIGFFLFTGYVFGTVGLLHTTPAKSGFITGITVVIVPFFYYLLTKIFPGWWAVIGAVLAVIGLYLMSANQTMGLGLGLGDLLTLIGAFLFAGHLIAIASHVVKSDPIILSIVQIAVTGLASFTVALFFEPTAGMFSHSYAVWGAIIYAVLFCTIGSFVTQTIAQRYTTPTHAVLILSTEAVFAGLFSYLFWQEIFTAQKIIGASLILVGILITELRPLIAARYNSYLIRTSNQQTPALKQER